MTALVRALRKERGLTLEALAAQTGLTKSYLSKIERERSTPSIAVAMRIARALDVDVGQLFADDASRSRMTIERAPARAGADRYHPVAAGMLGKAMSPFVVRPGRDFADDPHPEHSGQEFVFVVSGSIELDHGGTIVTLDAGDCAYFDASLDHRLRSTGPVDAEVLVVACNDSH